MSPFKTSLKKLCLIVLVGIGTAACTAPGTQTLPPVTFTASGPLAIAVSNVETTATFNSSYDLPRVENEMPVTPEAVLQRWAKDRIAATGEGTGTLRYTVTDAKVVASALQTDQTLKAWFTDEQAVRYTIDLAGMVEINDPAINANGAVEAAANRSVTVPEGATLNERDKVLYDLIVAATRDFDDALEANVRQYLASWVR